MIDRRGILFINNSLGRQGVRLWKCVVKSIVAFGWENLICFARKAGKNPKVIAFCRKYDRHISLFAG